MFELLTGLILVAGSVYLLFQSFPPLRPIWSGDTPADARVPTQFGQVPPRNYLAYLLWLVPGTFGVLMIGVVLLLRFAGAPEVLTPVFGWAGLGSLIVAAPLVLLHMLVSATNRPRFVVPPPYRDEPGAIAAFLRRKNRGV
jgi:hypothetical protein